MQTGEGGFNPLPSPSTIMFEPFFLIFCPTRGGYFNIVLSFKFVNCYSRWKNCPYRTNILCPTYKIYVTQKEFQVFFSYSFSVFFSSIKALVSGRLLFHF